MRLKEKSAVITGAANGIGLAIAQAFATEGASVVLADIDEEAGTAAAQAIVDNGGTARFVRCDVSKGADIAAAIDTAISAHGKLDVMVNNAAVAIGGMPLHEMTPEEWDRLIATNLTSVFHGCRLALPHMIEAGSGVIINMASAQGHVGLDGWTAYAGAKGAVMSMSRQMAVEFGKQGIRVNSISPGTIATPMNVGVVNRLGEHVGKAWDLMHPVGRIGRPEEVAEAAVYLASDLAAFTTGIDLKVDGGLTATPRYLPDLFAADETGA